MNIISHQDDMWPKTITNETIMTSVVVPAEGHRPDIRIYFPFASHPLRTLNPDEADLFLVPAPWALLSGQQFKQAMKRLLLQPEFRSHANQHFVISPKSFEFDKNIKNRYKRQFLDRHRDQLQNMTIVKDKDDALIEQTRQQQNNITNKNSSLSFEWGKQFDQYAHSYLDHVVSMGLQDFTVPYRPASWERFTNEQTIWLFFHPRQEAFSDGGKRSSLFRFALMNNTWPAHFSPTSIGHDLPPTEWRHDFWHSKFCLVVRGDDPASRSLSRAIHAGCIPVIVSDYLPIFSPPLRRTLNLEDFSIIIQEDDFLQHPVGSILDLQVLEESLLKEKNSSAANCPTNPLSRSSRIFVCTSDSKGSLRGESSNEKETRLRSYGN